MEVGGELILKNYSLLQLSLWYAFVEADLRSSPLAFRLIYWPQWRNTLRYFLTTSNLVPYQLAVTCPRTCTPHFYQNQSLTDALHGAFQLEGEVESTISKREGSGNTKQIGGACKNMSTYYSLVQLYSSCRPLNLEIWKLSTALMYSSFTLAVFNHGIEGIFLKFSGDFFQLSLIQLSYRHGLGKARCALL